MTKYIKTKSVRQTLKKLDKQVPEEFLHHLDIYIEQKLRILADTSYNKKRLNATVWNLVLPIGR
jgi:hypothetical protein